MKDKGTVLTIKHMRTFKRSDETTVNEAMRKHCTSAESCMEHETKVSQKIDQSVLLNPMPKYVSTLCV